MSKDPDSSRVILGSAIAGVHPFGPTACLMPDLSDITSPVKLDFILNAMNRVAGSHDPKAWAYLNIFIRITDKAILEFETARSVLTEFCIERNRSSLYLRTIGHLENCIGSMRRVELILTRVRGVLRDPGMPRDVRKEAERQLASVSPVRTVIEHMDEWIGKDKLGEGAPITMAVSDEGDAVRIASDTISFKNLASILRALHNLASVLADYREGQNSPTPGTV